jgi:hypothetical protein
MILRADLYLSAREEEDDILAASIAAVIKKQLCKNRWISWPKKKGRPAAPLQPVAHQAIMMANALVADLDLDFSNEDHLFSPMPWKDPGEEVVLDKEIIENMKRAVKDI